MTKSEFQRHFEYMRAAKNKPRMAVHVVSRRSAKHNSVGKVFANSRVIPGVSLERVFNKPNWTKYANDLLARGNA